MEIVELYKFTCSRCAHKWIAKVDLPKQCPKCKSPYWNKERRLIGDKGLSVYGFERIALNEWVTFPFFTKMENGAVVTDAYLNEKRARALAQYMARHGYKYTWRADWRDGLQVYRTK